MNPKFVLDSSITVAWCFQEERTATTDAIQDRLTTEYAIVSEHWRLEVANALLVGERRKRILTSDVTNFLLGLDQLLIDVDTELQTRAFIEILPLARAYNLTTYDAAYLNLALRRQLPLATLDDDLRRAATSLGVQLLGK